MDTLLRATAADSQIRIFACVTTELVEKARTLHDTSPVCTAALGRLLTAGAMMGAMQKGEDDLMTLRINAGGPIAGLTVTADSKARVKGFVGNPHVDLPLKPNKKLDVGGAIGVGFLDVIKDMGLKEPYLGQVPLQTGEIGDDLTYYFAASEQVPSSVGLGVLVDRDLSVAASGGFIVQLMPFAPEEVIAKLEENVARVTSVTDLLSNGTDAKGLIDIVCEGLDPVIVDEIKPEFYCNCSRERVEKALISVGKAELEDMIKDGDPIEMNCHFCSSHYIFTVDELKTLYKKAK